MKKKRLLLVLGFIIFLVISYNFLVVLFYFNKPKNSREYITSIIEVDIEKCNIEIESDTHGGFLGDGDYFAKINCSDMEDYNDFCNWKEMPLSDSLKKVMEMRQCDDQGCSTAILNILFLK